MMKTIRKWHGALALALVCPVFASEIAHAQDLVSILLGSHHIWANSNFEEFNPGAFLTWEGDKMDWTVGGFRNSYGGASTAVMVARSLWEQGVFDLSLTGGLALYPGEGRNFDVHAGDVIPLVGLHARYGNAFVQAFQSDGATADGLLTFGLTFSLDQADP